MFKTSDIVLASTLKIHGFKMVSIDLENGGEKGTFVFEDHASGVAFEYPCVEDLLDAFELSDVKVEPIAFHTTLRQLTTSVRRKINNRG